MVGVSSTVDSGVDSGDEEALGYVMPGLCNAHSHAFQRALAGHTEQRSPAGTGQLLDAGESACTNSPAALVPKR